MESRYKGYFFLKITLWVLLLFCTLWTQFSNFWFELEKNQATLKGKGGWDFKLKYLEGYVSFLLDSKKNMSKNYKGC